MGSKQLAYRLAAYFGGVSLREALHGSNDDKEVFRWGLEEVSRMPIHVDSASRNIDMVASSIRQMKRVHGCEVIWIDYLQLLTSTTGLYTQEYERMHSTRIAQVRLLLREVA